MNKTHEHQCVFVPRLDGWEYCECGNKVQVYDPVQGKHIDERMETTRSANDLLQKKYLVLLRIIKQLANDPAIELFSYDLAKYLKQSIKNVEEMS